MESREKIDMPPEARTHFGFQEVASADKESMVRGVFDSVAGRYDLMNDLMSGGVHRLWKASLIDQLRPRSGLHLLDVAGGTGDIATRFLSAGGDRVTVCDINANMVRVGRDREIDTNKAADIDAGLREARRVLRPGGRFLCLEFSRVADPVLLELYDRFSFGVLPLLGRFVARDADAYQYLAESIRRFPPQEELATRMAAAGLERTSFRNLSRGIVAIHQGWRI